MAGDVRERVIKAVVETLKVEPGQIRDESKFVEDLGAESMQGVELIAAFEEEFDIEMDEEEALDVKTIGTAVQFIEGHLG